MRINNEYAKEVVIRGNVEYDENFKELKEYALKRLEESLFAKLAEGLMEEKASMKVETETKKNHYNSEVEVVKMLKVLIVDREHYLNLVRKVEHYESIRPIGPNGNSYCGCDKFA